MCTMMKKRFRLTISILLVLLTLGVLGYYLSHHRNLVTQLAHTPPQTILWLTLLYVLFFGSLALILQASLRMCRTTLRASENLLLNAYSLFINYFVPGQGGPALRGVYLKKRHNVRVRSYVFVTLLYYGLYGIVSVFLLLAGSRPWWQTMVGVAIAIAGSVIAIQLYLRRSRSAKESLNLNLQNLSYLLAATVVQAVIQITIYAVELHSVNAHAALRQTITYTGAANLALFVALTPGAIGIRESFLLFSERLHHISSAHIVAASIIDRAVYLLFLAVLGIFTIGFHAKEKLRVKQAVQTSLKEE
jgi:uncharacterized membrane protein YbhN (UPF0104 family)